MNAPVALVLALALALPARAADDVPLVVLDKTPLVQCQPGDIVLHPEAYRALDKRVDVAEAKLAVYEKNPPLPWWGVVLLVTGGAALGVVFTVGVYEAGKGVKP